MSEIVRNSQSVASYLFKWTNPYSNQTNACTPNEYADDCWKAIKAVGFGSGHRISINIQVWTEAVCINREHFSVNWFSSLSIPFEIKAHVICNLDLPMSAYIATDILFDNIEKGMPSPTTKDDPK
jgi:hypothetical protein